MGLDDARGVHARIGGVAYKADLGVEREIAGKVGSKQIAAREHGAKDGALVGIIAGDLLCHTLDSLLDFMFGHVEAEVFVVDLDSIHIISYFYDEDD